MYRAHTGREGKGQIERLYTIFVSPLLKQGSITREV